MAGGGNTEGLEWKLSNIHCDQWLALGIADLVVLSVAFLLTSKLKELKKLVLAGTGFGNLVFLFDAGLK